MSHRYRPHWPLYLQGGGIALGGLFGAPAFIVHGWWEGLVLCSAFLLIGSGECVLAWFIGREIEQDF